MGFGALHLLGFGALKQQANVKCTQLGVGTIQ